MKHLVRVIALAVFASACAASGPAADRRVTYKLDSYYEGLCGETAGLSQCAKQIEKRAMEEHPDQAIRNGDELIVNSEESESEVFENTPDVQYAYAGSAFGADVVLEVVEESWSALLVFTPNQAPLRLPGLPLFSPDGEYFATSSLDIDAGYKPNTVQIWGRRKGGFEQQYELTEFPESGGPLSIRWASPDALEVQVVTLEQLYEGVNDSPITFMITQTPQGWMRSNTGER